MWVPVKNSGAMNKTIQWAQAGRFLRFRVEGLGFRVKGSGASRPAMVARATMRPWRPPGKGPLKPAFLDLGFRFRV